MLYNYLFGKQEVKLSMILLNFIFERLKGWHFNELSHTMLK